MEASSKDIKGGGKLPQKKQRGRRDHQKELKQTTRGGRRRSRGDDARRVDAARETTQRDAAARGHRARDAGARGNDDAGAACGENGRWGAQ
jgi:hypothetical protein